MQDLMPLVELLEEAGLRLVVSQEMIDTFHLHPENLSQDMRNIVAHYIANNPQQVQHDNETHINETCTAITAKTHKAKSLLVETSKAGRKLRKEAALPQLYSEEGGSITTGYTGKRKSREVASVLSLSFEALDEWKSILPANTRVSKFAMAVLTHCMTLINAGNEYTTSKTIFRQMSGNKGKEATPEMQKAIQKALSILACTRIRIDTSEEFEAGFTNRKFFEGALLPNTISGQEIITLNGSIIEDAIHFLGQSPLFEYARTKGQISSTNIPVAMLAVPKLNTTEENIVLLDYLIRTYADMTNAKSDRNKNIISYDTLYDYLGVEGSNPNTIYTWKKRIRAAVRTVLDHWIELGAIKGYQELTADNNPAKQGAKIAKVRLDFFTARELGAIHDSGQNAGN